MAANVTALAISALCVVLSPPPNIIAFPGFLQAARQTAMRQAVLETVQPCRELGKRLD
jgi:hypothetical protein